MLHAGDKYISEVFDAPHVPPGLLDLLLADAWRHFGTQFYRYNIGIHEFDIRDVIPLRIRLAHFSRSKSQRRVLRRNGDLRLDISPIDISAEAKELFERHKQRFKFGIPDSLYDFLSSEPARVPCEGRQLTAHLDEKLVAASYFDVADRSVSAIYAMFEPELPRRSLGIFTMLKEIEFAIEHRKEF